VVLSRYSGFCHHENWTPWYSWNIAESGAKTPKTKKKLNRTWNYVFHFLVLIMQMLLRLIILVELK
jgi:hypothetical protein